MSEYDRLTQEEVGHHHDDFRFRAKTLQRWRLSMVPRVRQRRHVHDGRLPSDPAVPRPARGRARRRRPLPGVPGVHSARHERPRPEGGRAGRLELSQVPKVPRLSGLPGVPGRHDVPAGARLPELRRQMPAGASFCASAFMSLASLSHHTLFIFFRVCSAPARSGRPSRSRPTPTSPRATAPRCSRALCAISSNAAPMQRTPPAVWPTATGLRC